VALCESGRKISNNPNSHPMYMYVLVYTRFNIIKKLNIMSKGV